MQDHVVTPGEWRALYSQVLRSPALVVESFGGALGVQLRVDDALRVEYTAHAHELVYRVLVIFERLDVKGERMTQVLERPRDLAATKREAIQHAELLKEQAYKARTWAELWNALEAAANWLQSTADHLPDDDDA
jgi:hypothetical protein